MKGRGRHEGAERDRAKVGKRAKVEEWTMDRARGTERAMSGRRGGRERKRESV